MGRETDGEKVGPLPRFPTRMSGEAIHQLVHASQPSAWHVPCRRDVAWADVGLDRCVVPGTGLSREVRHASEDRRELGNQIASDTTRG